MKRSIIIDVGVVYTRAAVFEDNQLVNVLLENHHEKQVQGTIYQGRITNIVKGIKAAFVDINEPKKAFLHVEDIPEQLKVKLQNNQRMAIQIIKEGVGNKGPKATAFINLTGKFMVLLPFEKNIGISKKIEDRAQRERLKNLFIRNNPKKYGIIVRTEATKATDQQLINELEGLIEKWATISQMSIGAASGTILYEEPPFIIKVVREYGNEQTKEIVINDGIGGQLIQEFLSKNLKDITDRVRIVNHLSNLYGAYHIDQEIEKALKKKIWLKSGANIIIEKTEAMNVIDVNSAKFITAKQKGAMILKTNLQAAKESARQIRLRNLSGIILIDFIDMDDTEHQDQVIETLELELKKDKIKTTIYPMTSLGLVQITRQRKNNSLQEQIMQHCSCCNNPHGYMTYGYLLVGIEKRIRDIVRESIHKDITITAAEAFIKYIKRFSSTRLALESKYGVQIKLIIDAQKEKTEYDLRSFY